MTSAFEQELEKLVAVEVAEAIKAKDAERCAAIVDRLCHSIALTIAISCKGDPKGIDTMLEGTTHHMYELASMFGKLGLLVSAVPEKGGKLS